MDVRVRPLTSQVERIRLVQDLRIVLRRIARPNVRRGAKSRTQVARHGGEKMDVRARPHRSQVERIRRIQDLGLGGGGLLGQMSEDEEKVVH